MPVRFGLVYMNLSCWLMYSQLCLLLIFHMSFQVSCFLTLAYVFSLSLRMIICNHSCGNIWSPTILVPLQFTRLQGSIEADDPKDQGTRYRQEILGAISSIIGELISSTVFAIFLKERKKAIWSSSGSFSAQPRKACSDARQHSDHGSRWLATVQALWVRQNGIRP